MSTNPVIQQLFAVVTLVFIYINNLYPNQQIHLKCQEILFETRSHLPQFLIKLFVHLLSRSKELCCPNFLIVAINENISIMQRAT